MIRSDDSGMEEYLIRAGRSLFHSLMYASNPPYRIERLMSKNSLNFLVHFSDCSYNVIACFYAEIYTIYQISIFQK